MQSDSPVKLGRPYLDGLLTRMCLAVPPELNSWTTVKDCLLMVGTCNCIGALDVPHSLLVASWCVTQSKWVCECDETEISEAQCH